VLTTLVGLLSVVQITSVESGLLRYCVTLLHSITYTFSTFAIVFFGLIFAFSIQTKYDGHKDIIRSRRDLREGVYVMLHTKDIRQIEHAGDDEV